jgi:hypothetical protein
MQKIHQARSSAHHPAQGDVMITIRNLNFGSRIFGAGILTVLLIGAGLLISAFTTEANSKPTFGKGDRLDIRPTTCAQQVWPYYENNCLRTKLTDTGSSVRVIAIDRR